MTFAVYTDLDGTLLDHDTYRADAALPALKKLNELQILTIPVTSKTRAEVLIIRRELNLSGPFIVENGAAIFIPQEWLKNQAPEGFRQVDQYWVRPLSPDLAYWRTQLAQISQLIPNAFKSFSQMSNEEVSELTGLPMGAAARARQREFSDPLYWFGTEEQFLLLLELCRPHGISVVKGGRFVHLLKGANKGEAVRWLHRYLSGQARKSMHCVVAGDGENDLSMLAVADFPIQVKSTAHDFPEFQHPNLIRTTHAGPAGWREAIEALIEPVNSTLLR